MFELQTFEDGRVELVILTPVNDNMRFDDGDPHLFVGEGDNVIPIKAGK